jgi:hypothetical protein
MEIWELVAREQVRDTIARYNHAGDSGRFDEMVEQFHQEGILELTHSSERPAERHEGRAAMRAFFAGVATNFAERDHPTGHPAGRPAGTLRHCVTNTRIAIESRDSARADSYFLVITDNGLDHWGRYRDRLAPAETRWLLTHRSVRTDGYSETSAFAPA